MGSQLVYRIIESKRYDMIPNLNNIDFIDLITRLYYEHYTKVPYDSLNEVQQTIYNIIKFDDLLHEQGIVEMYLNEPVSTFNMLYENKRFYSENRANITHKLITTLINRLPSPLVSFMDLYSNGSLVLELTEVENNIINYPDGTLSSIIKQYLANSNNIQKLFENIKEEK